MTNKSMHERRRKKEVKTEFNIPSSSSVLPRNEEEKVNSDYRDSRTKNSAGDGNIMPCFFCGKREQTTKRCVVSLRVCARDN